MSSPAEGVEIIVARKGFCWGVVLSAWFVLCPHVAGTESPVNEIYVGLGHADTILTMAFSIGQELLITGAHDGVRLWEVRTHRELDAITNLGAPVETVAVSPTGQCAIVCRSSPTIVIWDAISHSKARSLTATEDVEAITFSSSGKYLATGGANKTISIWDMTTGHVIRSIGPNSSVISALAFSPNDELIAAGCANGGMELWTVATGALMASMNGHMNRIAGVQFSPNGLLIGSAAWDGKVIIWAVDDGRNLRTIVADKWRAFSLRFSQDNKRVLVGTIHGPAKLFDVVTGKELNRFGSSNGSVFSAMFFEQDKRVACAQGESVFFFDAMTGQECGQLEGVSEQSFVPAVMPDAKICAVPNGNAVDFWDVGTGKIVQRLSLGDRTPLCVTLTANGEQAITGDGDDTVRVWDVATQRELRKYVGHVDDISCIAVSPDGKTVATGSLDKTVILWNSGTVSEIATLLHGLPVFSISFSPDGAFLAAGGIDDDMRSKVVVWDIRARQRVHEHTGHVAGFSPDGAWLVVAGSDEKTCLLGVGTWKTVRELVGHDAFVTSACFDPSGEFVLTASYDELVALYEAATGVLVGRIKGGMFARFSSDSNQIVTVGKTGVIRIWDRENLSLLASMARVSRDGEFVAWTPEGYFTGTPKAEKLVSLKQGNRSYPLGQYRDVLYRPDLVVAKLAGAAVDQLNPVPAIPGMAKLHNSQLPFYEISPPTVVLITPEDDAYVNTNQVKVVAEASAKTSQVSGIVLSINGKVQRSVGGITLANKERCVRQEWMVRLAEGINTIEVYALSDTGIRSETATRTVTFRILAGTDNAFEPSLWVLAIGVSKYKNPAYNLTYAASDASRLVEAFQGHANGLFGECHTQLLTDAQVTREEISDACEKFLSRCRESDVVVIFYAGHGVLDAKGRFFFMTHDADAAEPYKRGYSSVDIQGQLSALSAQKSVLLIDTCHAGAVGDDDVRARGTPEQDSARMEFLADQLKEAAGCFIVMASTGKENSFEGSAWKGGVFTTAVTEAVSGKAAKSGVVTMLGLMDYVDSRVIELTRGAQHPTLKMPRIGRNFPIAQSR